MRNELTRERLRGFMNELARTATRRGRYRVYLTGGGTAVYLGWRESSLDAVVSADRDEVFRDIQGIKERLNINVEFARPDDFVPLLNGSEQRHILIETVGRVTYYHYDPYTQTLSKIVRGLARDWDDARAFLREGFVDAQTFEALVALIPDSAYAKYPRLSRAAVEQAVKMFLSEIE